MATTWTRTGTARSGRASQATTESAPSGNAGVDLSGVGSVSVAFHAPAGQTFDGTGSLLSYRQLAGTWMRAPRADIDMSDYAGLSDAALPALAVDAPVGRFLYVPSGVGLSSGSTVTSDYVCTARNGSQVEV